MRTLSLTALILTLTASPVGAAMVSVQNGDEAGQCGVSSARLVVDQSEDARVFPEEVSPCGNTDNENTTQPRADAIGMTSVSGANPLESSLEIAVLIHPSKE